MMHSFFEKEREREKKCEIYAVSIIKFQTTHVYYYFIIEDLLWGLIVIKS